jgi:hypothetical protein
MTHQDTSSGSPTLRMHDGDHVLAEGDVVPFPLGPEGGHQIRNDSEATARVLIVSAHVNPDVAEYPDTGKVATIVDGKHARPTPSSTQAQSPRRSRRVRRPSRDRQTHALEQELAREQGAVQLALRESALRHRATVPDGCASETPCAAAIPPTTRIAPRASQNVTGSPRATAPNVTASGEIPYV